MVFMVKYIVIAGLVLVCSSDAYKLPPNSIEIRSHIRHELSKQIKLLKRSLSGSIHSNGTSNNQANDSQSLHNGSHAENNGTSEHHNSTGSHGNGTEGEGTDEGQEAGDHEHHSIHVASWNFEHVKAPFTISVFLLAAGIAKLGFHHANFLSSKVPESCLLIILGTGVGAILYGVVPDKEDSRPGLTSELFFLYLLPPIILESAYSLHDRSFYDNVGTVLIYAVVGTVLNCFLIGPSIYGLIKGGAMGSGMVPVTLIQCLVFSAVIVAVDPVAVLAIFQEIGVNNNLYFLVFGESLLNDAVTVVLYNMMKTMHMMDAITADQIVLGIVQFFVVSLGGLTVGVVFGVLTAVITKYTESCRVVEPLAVFMLAYISYLMAEMFHFSGIISIIGCGLVQAQYAFHNISRKSYTTVKYFSKMQSATSDCIIFMFLGVALFRAEMLDMRNWNIAFILWTILLCLVYRFIVVFGLTFLLNRSGKIRKIDLEEQFIMAYGGLRGAVAFSLVDVLDKNNLPKGHFLTNTVMVIFFTVFVQGITIKPLVKLLRVKMEQKEKLLLSEEINSHVTDHIMAGIEEVLGEKGENYVRELLEYYNSHYLKMWLQRDPISNDEQIMQYFEKLALEQHFENLTGSKMVQDKYSSEQHLLDNTSIDDNEEPISDDDSNIGFGHVVISVPSVTAASSEDMNSEIDAEIVRQQVNRRRKSTFAVNVSKSRESRIIGNPTAVDVRKIMVPPRRQNFRKLDKNIKSDDSENDLIRYLQDKQSRTRRMSQALWPSLSPNSSHDGSQLRRTSVAPAVVSGNYRRRLSLAVPVPPEHERLRGASMGNVLRRSDSPGRRRLRFNRWNTDSFDSKLETPVDILRERYMDKPPDSPRSLIASIKEEDSLFQLDAINEHDNEHTEVEIADSCDNSPTSNPSGEKPKWTLHTASSVRAKRPTDFASSNAQDAKENLKRSKSLDKGSHSSHHSVANRSSSGGSRKSNKSLNSPDRNIRFVPSKESPSVRRKHLQKSHIARGILDSATGSIIQRDKDTKDNPGGLTKNPSYTFAVSFDEFSTQL